MQEGLNLSAILIADIFSIVALTIIFIQNKWWLVKERTNTKILRYALCLSIISCVADIVVSHLNGIDGSVVRFLLYIGHTWLFSMNLIIGGLLVNFFSLHLLGEAQKELKIITIMLGTFGFTILAINFFFPVAFKLDGSNVFSRGHLYSVFFAIEVLCFLICIAIYIYAKMQGGLLQHFPMPVFILPVLACSIIHLLNFGINLALSGVAISISGIILSLINEMIFIDRLTGLLNRTYLDNFEYDNRSKKNTLLSAIMLDINSFKYINDTFGHNEGDRALKLVAKVLKTSVTSRGNCVRYAGDEFVILLNTTDENEIKKMITKINNDLTRASVEADLNYTLSVSYGYSVFDIKNTTMSDVLNVIDKNMYVNKKEFYTNNKDRDRRNNIAKISGELVYIENEDTSESNGLFSIFLNLADDYVALIDVNAATKREIQYILTSETNSTLPAWSNSDKYQIAIEQYADTLIVDEDKARFLRATEFNTMYKYLQEHSEFVIDYDTIIDNERKHFSGKFILNTTFNPEPHIYIGIRDITRTKEIELKSKDAAEYERYKNILQRESIDRRTILIIEDDPLNRDMLETVLSDSYYTISAENGQVGLELLSKTYNKISLILLDVNMPVMDGYEFLRRTQSDSVYKHIPVVVTTSIDGNNEEEECFSLGATDFVSKPYNFNIILQRIQTIIKLRESAATLAAVEYDELTGLYTKEAFIHNVQTQINLEPDESYVLGLLNVKDFKSINANYSVEIGDKVLKKIAEILRKMDDSGATLGRYSDDRFLVFYNKKDLDPNDFTATWKELHNAFPTIANITLKYGIYQNIDTSLSVNDMIYRATLAMEDTMERFDVPIGFYDEKINLKYLREVQIEQSMLKAYDNEEFEVFYQPKHDAQTGKLVGAEALIRWNHPELGMISPGEFIPIFEKTGFIGFADFYMWEKTCRNLAKWMEQGINVVPCSVNFSKYELSSETIINTIERTASKAGVDPSYLHLEVTETMFGDNPEIISNNLMLARQKGFKIELDDFGAGYSSLNSLADLPCDVVKFDMSFIKNLSDPRRKEVLRALCALSNHLGLTTLCEGLETKEELDIVREVGVQIIQGYYYSRPMNQEDFENYMIKNS